MLRNALAIGLALCAGMALAQKGAYQGGVVRADNVPLADQMGIEQRLGNQVPGDVFVTESDGTKIKLQDLYGDVPIVFMPMFNLCNGICILEQDSLLKTLGKMREPVGEKLKVVMFSIHPKETPDLAKSKKTLVLDRYHEERKRKGYEAQDTSKDWHYLTADWETIQLVTNALGFKFSYNEQTGNVNHPAGIMILTPEGKVSSYIYGKDYPTRVVQDDVQVAKEGRVGKEAEIILLGCIRVDPHTGERTVVVENVVKLGGVATVITILTSILVMNRKYKHTGGQA